MTAAPFSFTAAGVMTVLQSPLTLPTLIQGGASPQILRINSQYSQIGFEVNNASIMAITVTGMSLQTPFVETVSGVTMVMGTKGSQSLVMRTNTLDRWAVDASGMLIPIASNVDIGTSGGPSPRRIFGGSFNFQVTVPPQITSDQHNYNPGPGGVFLLNANASVMITGWAGGVAGRLISVMGNGGDGTTPITLKANHTGSSVGNRFYMNNDINLANGSGSSGMINGNTRFVYDETKSGWLNF